MHSIASDRFANCIELRYYFRETIEIGIVEMG